jgi:hypothetical protein
VIDDAYDGTNPGDNENHAAGDPTFIYSTDDRTLYYDDNGADPGYAVIATVQSGDHIEASDVSVAA